MYNIESCFFKSRCGDTLVVRGMLFFCALRLGSMLTLHTSHRSFACFLKFRIINCIRLFFSFSSRQPPKQLGLVPSVLDRINLHKIAKKNTHTIRLVLPEPSPANARCLLSPHYVRPQRSFWDSHRSQSASPWADVLEQLTICLFTYYVLPIFSSLPFSFVTSFSSRINIVILC